MHLPSTLLQAPRANTTYSFSIRWSVPATYSYFISCSTDYTFCWCPLVFLAWCKLGEGRYCLSLSHRYKSSANYWYIIMSINLGWINEWPTHFIFWPLPHVSIASSPNCAYRPHFCPGSVPLGRSHIFSSTWMIIFNFSAIHHPPFPYFAYYNSFYPLSLSWDATKVSLISRYYLPNPCLSLITALVTLYNNCFLICVQEDEVHVLITILTPGPDLVEVC